MRGVGGSHRAECLMLTAVSVCSPWPVRFSAEACNIVLAPIVVRPGAESYGRGIMDISSSSYLGIPPKSSIVGDDSKPPAYQTSVYHGSIQIFGTVQRSLSGRHRLSRQWTCPPWDFCGSWTSTMEHFGWLLMLDGCVERGRRMESNLTLLGMFSFPPFPSRIPPRILLPSVASSDK